MVVYLAMLYKLLKIFSIEFYERKNRDRAVCIATVYGLDRRGVGVRLPLVARFFPFQVVQAVSGAHLASYPRGTGGSFPGGKAAGHEAGHSPPPSAEVKNTWIYTSTTIYAFMA
jgi:hypothetical protein